MLRLKKVSKRFGKLEALKKIDISIKENEIRAIIGPNGAGKTTLVNVTAGVIKIDSGEITLNGSNITRTLPYKRTRMGIGRTYQISKPFNTLTVYENVLVGATYGGNLAGKKPEEIALWALESVGLKGREEEPAQKLTSEQLKLLDLARALSENPKYLFIDEMGAGLSESELDKTYKIIKTINEYGISVIYIGHVMRLVRKLTDRIIVMNEGSVIFEGSYDDVASSSKVIEVYLGKSYAKI